MGRPKGQSKVGGRQKGTPNKITTAVREMVLEALDRAGGVEYLIGLATQEPKAFSSLLGRCIPQAVQIEGGLPLVITRDMTKPPIGQDVEDAQVIPTVTITEGEGGKLN